MWNLGCFAQDIRSDGNKLAVGSQRLLEESVLGCFLWFFDAVGTIVWVVLDFLVFRGFHTCFFFNGIGIPHMIVVDVLTLLAISSIFQKWATERFAI